MKAAATVEKMTRLEQLIARRDRAAEKAREANKALGKANWDITEWAGEQVKRELAKRGITPGKSVVRMKVRKTRNGDIVVEQTECLLESVGRVHPPTMERGALGPNACSSDMWWTAYPHWRNVRKDGTPGAWHDTCYVSGDTAQDLAAKIEHVRDL